MGERGYSAVSQSCFSRLSVKWATVEAQAGKINRQFTRMRGKQLFELSLEDRLTLASLPPGKRASIKVGQRDGHGPESSGEVMLISARTKTGRTRGLNFSGSHSLPLVEGARMREAQLCNHTQLSCLFTLSPFHTFSVDPKKEPGNLYSRSIPSSCPSYSILLIIKITTSKLV